MTTTQPTGQDRKRGRPMLCPKPVVLDIVNMHAGGTSYRRIAAVLNQRGTPTPTARGPWTYMHVYRINMSAAANRVRRSRKEND